MEVYPEQIVVILGAIFILAWLELKLHILARKLAQTSLQGFGVWMIILGGVLLIASSLGWIDQSYGIYVAVGGFVIYLVGWALSVWGKRERLEIEEEKARYLKQVRKGLKAGDAGKTALNFLKDKISEPLKQVAAVKEFKTWNIYFRGNKSNKKYKVVVDFDGDVATWETMGDLPTWLKGPY